MTRRNLFKTVVALAVIPFVPKLRRKAIIAEQQDHSAWAKKDNTFLFFGTEGGIYRMYKGGIPEKIA